MANTGISQGYDACGNAPDCYHDFESSHCPYDPYGTRSGAQFKLSDLSMKDFRACSPFPLRGPTKFTRVVDADASTMEIRCLDWK